MLSDLRFAVRLFRRAPVFAATAIVTLALGIGANVAVFTIVDAVLFRPLPLGEPDRLVMLSESHVATGQHRVGVLPGSLLDWRERTRSFQGLSLFAISQFHVTNRGEPIQITARRCRRTSSRSLGCGRCSGAPSPRPKRARHTRPLTTGKS